MVSVERAAGHHHGFFGADQGERTAATQSRRIAEKQHATDGGGPESRDQSTAAFICGTTGSGVVQEPDIGDSQAGRWQESDTTVV